MVRTAFVVSIGLSLLPASAAFAAFNIPRDPLPVVPQQCTIEQCNYISNCDCCYHFRMCTPAVSDGGDDDGDDGRGGGGGGGGGGSGGGGGGGGGGGSGGGGRGGDNGDDSGDDGGGGGGSGGGGA